MSKPMRETMPTVAAWIDELRETFGADTINAAIRNGVGGGDHFYASENGQQVGSIGLAGKSVRLVEMVIRPREDGELDERAAKTRAALRAYAPIRPAGGE